MPVPARVEALHLVDRVAGLDPAVRYDYAEILSDPTSPPPLQSAAADIILAKEDPTWAGPMIALLPRLKPADPLRAKILDWLSRHPGPVALAEIAKAWAPLEAADEAEPLYKEMVRRVVAGPWDQALLNAINSAEFSAAPYAIQVLAARVGRDALARSVAALTSQSSAVMALQAFLRTFDYLPATAVEFRAVDAIYQAHADSLESAARVAGTWKQGGTASTSATTTCYPHWPPTATMKS